ncbi:MAG: polysaccharide biosynthesis/export family protein [Candidatus Omnitrophota bacterium]
MRYFQFLLLIVLISFSAVFAEDYKIETGDVLAITVYDQSDLTTKTRVGPNGEINFPLLGTVQINGLTIDETQKKITSLLAEDYLVNPQVNVFIEEYHPKKVFVMGFVNRPGEYELPKDRPTSVLEAITMAGGFKDGAAQNGTKIIRKEAGAETTIPIKVTDITNKGDKEKDVAVKPGDIVVVPESFF